MWSAMTSYVGRAQSVLFRPDSLPCRLATDIKRLYGTPEHSNNNISCIILFYFATTLRPRQSAIRVQGDGQSCGLRGRQTRPDDRRARLVVWRDRGDGVNLSATLGLQEQDVDGRPLISAASKKKQTSTSVRKAATPQPLQQTGLAPHPALYRSRQSATTSTARGSPAFRLDGY